MLLDFYIDAYQLMCPINESFNTTQQHQRQFGTKTGQKTCKPPFLSGMTHNYAMDVVVTYTVLRINDPLHSHCSDVYDEQRQEFCIHIILTGKKTGKIKTPALNKQAIAASTAYFPHRREKFVFTNSRKDGCAISRVQSWRVIHFSAVAINNRGKSRLSQPVENLGIPRLDK